METPISNKKSAKRNLPKTPSKRLKLELLSTVELQEKHSQLLQKETLLDRQIAELEAKGFNADLSTEMQALHAYNDVKDVTQVVLGYLADVEQVTIAKLHKKYALPSD